LQILQTRTSKRNGQFSEEAFVARNSICGAKDLRRPAKRERRDGERKQKA